MPRRTIRQIVSRGMHLRQRQVENLSQQAERGIERNLFKRFEHLAPVRRFVIGWCLLLILVTSGVLIQNFDLSNYYQTLRPVPGGIYNEGIVGSFSNANPIYATSDVDISVSHLLFAGLFQYNDKNELIGDMASHYRIDTKGTTYTVYLKPHLTWQDGAPLTSQDVVFTYHLIQDADAQSPLASSWQGITISAPNASTVTFKLPDVLASFPYNLTTGILPQHILSTVPVVDLRSADFNTVHPVGSGPFAWQGLQVTGNDPEDAQEQIALVPFTKYQGGAPKLREFVVRAFSSADQLSHAFSDGLLTAAEGLQSVPASDVNNSSVVVHNLLFTAGNYVFFKTTTGVLADQQVREALITGANVPGIISNLGYPTHLVREPLLQGQLAYNPAYQQASYNVQAAKALLTKDGWIPNPSGTRYKAGVPLTFGISAVDTPEEQQVTNALQSDWRRLGVQLNVSLQAESDFQTTLSEHSYDSLLYGISIGVDPDVFVYWDSSQADIRSSERLNFSEYKDPIADEYLEAGRTRLNQQLRIVKYKNFLAAWQQDAPALGLYQPRLLYLTNGAVSGLSDHTINTATDRYDNVQNWEINVAKVTDR